MAGDIPNPDDPNKIDINLSLLSGQSGLAFEKFVQELEGLRKGIEALAHLQPSAAAQATREAARFYTPSPEEQRSPGLSSMASRATIFAPTGRSTGGAPSTPDIQTQQQITDAREADRFAKAKEARTALGEGLAALRTSDVNVRQAFNQVVRGSYRRRPLDIGAVAGYATHDEEEHDGGGAADDGQGGSATRDFGQDWWGRLRPDVVNAPLKIPRAGHFTAEDVLNTVAQAFSRRALRARTSTGEDLGIKRENFADGDAGYVQYQQALQDKIGSEGMPGDLPGDTLGNVGAMMYKAAHQWAPKAALLKQYYDRYVGITPGQLMTSGYEQGSSGEGGDIQLGPIGFRNPLNAAGGTGFATEWQNIKTSLGAGINREQAATIQEATINSGRNIHDPQHDQFYGVLKNLTKWNPAIGQSPATAEMLDKVMRYGGETSLKRFVETMKQIPDAASAAHVHINQMVQDMATMGDFNRSQGGTFYGGMQAAQNFALSTGMPGALLPGLAQNQFVQTQSFLESGYAPWQQGLMSPSQRTQSSVDAVLRMAPMVAGYSHARPGTKDKYGFTSGGATQQQMEAANLHMMFPELPPSAISDILKNGKKMKAQAGLVQDMRGVSHAVKGDQAWEDRYRDYQNAVHEAHSGDPSQRYFGNKWLQDHPWASSHGDVLRGKAGRAQRDMQQLLSGKGQRSWASLHKEMSDAGFSAKEIKQVEGAGKLPASLLTSDSKVNATKVAQSRQHKLEQIVAKHSEKFNNNLNDGQPKVTIELGKAAAKHFHLQTDPMSQAKLAAGAGTGSVNSPFGAGPTAMSDPYGG